MVSLTVIAAVVVGVQAVSSILLAAAAATTSFKPVLTPAISNTGGSRF